MKVIHHVAEIGAAPERVFEAIAEQLGLDDYSYGTYNFNWGYYMESLRMLLEEGSGKPFSPER